MLHVINAQLNQWTCSFWVIGSIEDISLRANADFEASEERILLKIITSLSFVVSEMPYAMHTCFG